MNELFGKLNEIRRQYRDGLINNTEALGEMAKVVGNKVLLDAAENRKKVNELLIDLGNLEEIKGIIIKRQSKEVIK